MNVIKVDRNSSLYYFNVLFGGAISGTIARAFSIAVLVFIIHTIHAV